MKTLKKFIGVLLALTMVLSVVQPAVLAATIELDMKTNKTHTLWAEDTYTVYNPIGEVDYTYQWFINSGEGVIQLSGSGETRTVTAIKPGKATVSCKVSMSYEYRDSVLGILKGYDEDFGGSWTVVVKGESVTVNLNANGGQVSPSSITTSQGSTYGALPTPTRAGYEFDGWYNGDKLVKSTTTVSSTATNHTLVAQWRKIEELTITGITVEDKVYDGTTKATITGGTLTGVKSGDDVSIDGKITGEFSSKDCGEDISIILDEIEITGADVENYRLIQPTGLKADITPIQVTVAADDQTKPAGNEDPVLTFDYSGDILPEDEFTGELQREQGEEAGKYDINQGTLTLGSNYQITFTKGTFEILYREPQNIIVEDIPAKTYGDDFFELNITPDAVSGLDNFHFSSSNEDVATVSVMGEVNIVGAGETEIIIEEPGDETYARTVVRKKLTVAKAPLNIGLKDISITYGDAIAYEFEYTGFVWNEDEKVLDAMPQVNGVPKKVNAGEYDLTLSGAEAANYDITYGAAKLTVAKRLLEVNKIKVFPKAADGTTTATISASSIEFIGLISGDDVRVDIGAATANFEDAEIGNGKNVTVTGISIIGDDADNYELYSTTCDNASGDIKLGIIAQDIAGAIHFNSTEKRNAETITMPNVPEGYEITIKSSDNEDVIGLDGKIAPVANDTQVSLMFTITNTADETDTFDKAVIVSIPASDKIDVTAAAGAGGSVTGAGEYLKNSEATVTAMPDSGYRFIGWYNGETLVSASSSYSFKVIDDISLTAKFEKIPSAGGGSAGSAARPKLYKIDFDTNGGSEIDSVTVYANTKVAEPAEPSRAGFTFDDWYIDEELSEKYDFSSRVLKSMTLYAKWVAMGDTLIILTIDDENAVVNGKNVTIDAAPKIVNNRTMLPIRFIAEALGATVEWDSDTSTVTIKADGIEISLTIGEAYAIVNGEEIELDSPSFIENNRTYLPLRFIAENLGANVEWNAETRQVTITK